MYHNPHLKLPTKRLIIIIFSPSPLWAHLTIQVDHLVTATFWYTMSTHTHKAHLHHPHTQRKPTYTAIIIIPFSLPSADPLSFLFEIFSLPLKKNNPLIAPPPPPHMGVILTFPTSPPSLTGVSGPQINGQY